MKVRVDKVRDAEALKLIRMVDLAVRNRNLETGFDGDNISLNNEVTLDTCGDKGNLVVYAVSKFSVITTAGERIKFLKLDRDDIYTLQGIIHDEYDIDYITA